MGEEKKGEKTGKKQRGGGVLLHPSLYTPATQANVSKTVLHLALVSEELETSI